MNRIGNAERKRRGSFKATQAPREMAVPAAVRPEMRRMPKGLTSSQRQLYRRQVRSATWLGELDIPALVMWVKAMDAVMAASDLKSVSKEVTVAAQLAEKLGFTPHGRLALGITGAERNDEPKVDAWSELRRPVAA